MQNIGPNVFSRRKLGVYLKLSLALLWAFLTAAAYADQPPLKQVSTVLEINCENLPQSKCFINIRGQQPERLESNSARNHPIYLGNTITIGDGIKVTLERPTSCQSETKQHFLEKGSHGFEDEIKSCFLESISLRLSNWLKKFPDNSPGDVLDGMSKNSGEPVKIALLATGKQKLYSGKKKLHFALVLSGKQPTTPEDIKALEVTVKTSDEEQSWTATLNDKCDYTKESNKQHYCVLRLSVENSDGFNPGNYFVKATKKDTQGQGIEVAKGDFTVVNNPNSNDSFSPSSLNDKEDIKVEDLGNLIEWLSHKNCNEQQCNRSMGRLEAYQHLVKFLEKPTSVFSADAENMRLSFELENLLPHLESDTQQQK